MELDTDVSRRSFNRQLLGSMLTYSLLETLCEHDAFADAVKPITVKWLAGLNQLGLDAKQQRISQVTWQEKVEQLFKQIELEELLKLLDFDRLTKNIKMVDNGARSLRFKFPEVEDLPKEYVFGKQIFALKKDRSVVPHGHNNMATAFLILKGKLHGRHYDRLEDEKEHFIIKPTINRNFSVGEYSSISDYRDNVHWFKAVAEPSFIFNIHILNVRPDSKSSTGRVYLDPNGESLKGGLIRAPRLGYKEAHQLYG